MAVADPEGVRPENERREDEIAEIEWDLRVLTELLETSLQD